MGAWLIPCDTFGASAQPAPKAAPPAESRPSPPSAPKDQSEKPGGFELDDLYAGAATILAAALGFGGAAWVERKSWERRKAEQIRQEQLTKLLAAARRIQEAKNAFGSVKAAIEFASSNSDASNSATLRTKAFSEASGAIAALRVCSSDLLMLQLELRVLKADMPALDAVGDAVAQVDGAASLLEAIKTANYAAVDAQGVVSHDISVQGLIDTAIASLRQS